LAIVALSGAGIFIAEARTNAAKQALADAEERERLLARESLIQKMTALRMRNHWAGWSDEAWSLAHEAAKIKKDDNLRDQYAATLQGMDARIKKPLKDCRASGLLFDAQGKRLLLGGTCDKFGKPQEQARIWDSATEQFISSGLAGDGPVVFRPDGVALQFVPKDLATFQLWNIAKQSSLGEFGVPGNKFHDPLSGLDYPAMCISPDGSLVAASCKVSTDKFATVIWDASTRKVMHQWPGNATALLFALDNSWLALGDGKGDVQILSLATEKELALLQNSRTPIHGLAHGRDCLRRMASDPARPPDLEGFLAVGDDGGGLIVWDLATRTRRTYCRGSRYEVMHIAFSPDGATFASCGRHHAKIWDLRTGRLILTFRTDNRASGLAYSPDGRSLAVGSLEPAPSVYIWELDVGRGLLPLQGLTGEVAQVVFSPKGDRLAALSVNWELGIWDVATGNLLHLLEVSPGFFADNAALAFSADSRKFAFSSGREASLWDVESGRLVRSWTGLPPGLCDNLAFGRDRRLLLIRAETIDGKMSRSADADPRKHPRVCRVRNLFATEPLNPVHVITEFNWKIYRIGATSDGSHFVVDGQTGNLPTNNHNVKVFDCTTGASVWSAVSSASPEGSCVNLADPGGKLLFFQPTYDSMAHLLEMPSKRFVATTQGAGNVSPNGLLRVHLLRLFRGDATAPGLELDVDLHWSSYSTPFNSAGTRLAWGNDDGSVITCDIAEVQRRLVAFDLGW
jgi:WD40 repeat protein